MTVRMTEKSEETQQIEFVNWVHREYPLAWPDLHHSPNGGLRSRLAGHKMKMMGTRRGFPDLVLYQKRGGFVGLVIEMKKAKGGRVDAEQVRWEKVLSECGYKCHVAYGQDQAKIFFEEFMQC